MKKILYIILCTFLMTTVFVNTTSFDIHAESSGEVGYVFYTDKEGNNPNEDWMTNEDDAFRFEVTSISPNEVSVAKAYFYPPLGDIVIPSTVSDGINTYNVTEIKDSAFYDCYDNITSVVIPASINTIGDSAFCYCANLTQVKFNSSTPPTIGSGIFDSCSSNLVIEVPVGSLSTYKAVSNLFDYKEKIIESITTWADLQASINDAPIGAVDYKEIKLKNDISPVAGDSYLVFPTGKKISLNLNGHTINRNCTLSEANGYVMKLESGAEVSIYGDGTITGGNNAIGPGAIYNNGAKLNISKTTISNNHGLNGGAIYNDNSGTTTIKNSKIKNNTAMMSGGGVYNKSGEVSLEYTEIDNNTADIRGGGIYASDFVGFTFSKITNCVTNNGGGVYVESGGRFEAVDGLLENNTADDKGGAIYVENGGVATLNNCYSSLLITNCTSTNGGAIYTNGVVGLETCTISNSGYGVYVDSSGRVFAGRSPIVVDNTKNIYIKDGGIITLGTEIDVHTPSSSMKLGISMATPGVFTTNDGTDYKSYFQSDDSSYKIFTDSEGKLLLAIPRTISFETNGGSTIDDVEIADNTKVKKPANPIKEGYKFDGWYSDEELTIPYNFNNYVENDFTLYAKWSKIRKPNKDYNVPNTGVSNIE